MSNVYYRIRGGYTLKEMADGFTTIGHLLSDIAKSPEKDVVDIDDSYTLPNGSDWDRITSFLYGMFEHGETDTAKIERPMWVDMEHAENWRPVKIDAYVNSDDAGIAFARGEITDIEATERRAKGLKASFDECRKW